MNDDDVVALLRQQLQAAVDQGEGAWAPELRHPTFGAAVYTFDGPALNVTLYNLGLRVSSPTESLESTYRDIVHIDGMALQQVVQLKAKRDLSAPVELRFHVVGSVHTFLVPFSLYTTLYGPLSRVVGR